MALDYTLKKPSSRACFAPLYEGCLTYVISGLTASGKVVGESDQAMEHASASFFFEVPVAVSKSATWARGGGGGGAAAGTRVRVCAYCRSLALLTSEVPPLLGLVALSLLVVSPSFPSTFPAGFAVLETGRLGFFA
jgi:hypothetical protein